MGAHAPGRQLTHCFQRLYPPHTRGLRYRQTDIPCTINALNDDRIEVIFDEPVAAVTPGQSAVFYSGEVCLGGGIIEQRLPLTV
ncbi:hypothetical protein ACH57_27425 [Salmonella enterica subsp. enterica serovar Typhimurium]|nr:hypothetical protein ACH57_27425 [Salmonella enterica subsp. enterica serovar Typhimurium]